jgi:hypothetical protein
MQKKVVLKLSKARFDSIWAGMIATGGASLVAYSHPVAALPWLSQALLWTALAVALILTIFVERTPSTFTDGESVAIASQVKAYPAAHTRTKLESDPLKSPSSSLKTEQTAEAVLRSAQVVSEAFTHCRFVDREANNWIGEKWQTETAVETRKVFEIYFAKYTAPRSRDLVNEAVEIAKRLQGTSLAVRLCNDGDIVISESSQPHPIDFDISYRLKGSAKTEGRLPN